MDKLRGKPKKKNLVFNNSSNAGSKNLILYWCTKNKPNAFLSSLQKELKKHGHLLLWTIPYSPKTQPIELSWAFAKRFAASCWTPKRTIAELMEHLHVAWAGLSVLYCQPIWLFEDIFESCRDPCLIKHFYMDQLFWTRVQKRIKKLHCGHPKFFCKTK